MIETAWQSEEYAELAQEVIEEHEDLHWILRAGISIGYLESDKEKKSRGMFVRGECEVVKPHYRTYCPHDFLITVYSPNVIGWDSSMLKKLLYHELLHVGMDDSGEEVRYITNPHDVQDFRAVIDRYGIDWARR